MLFRPRTSITRAIVLAAAVSLLGFVSPGSAGARESSSAARDLIFVANNFGGTVSVIDARTLASVAEINVIPDLEQRLAQMTIAEKIGYELVRSQTGHDQFADDVSLSPDGRIMYVSRSNLADVVAISLVTRQQLWRTKVSGLRADHMTISPDGRKIVVSAITSKKVEVLDAENGAVIGSFPAGDYPHENQYSADGKKIYNASIGTIPVPDWMEPLKGQRQVTVADAATLKVERVYSFSHGVRPFERSTCRSAPRRRR
jgi:YVTN family beta-propeller protein